MKAGKLCVSIQNIRMIWHPMFGYGKITQVMLKLCRLPKSPGKFVRNTFQKLAVFIHLNGGGVKFFTVKIQRLKFYSEEFYSTTIQMNKHRQFLKGIPDEFSRRFR